MLSRLLRQFLFWLVHLVINILVAVQNVYRRFCVKNWGLRTDEVTKNELKLIIDNMVGLSKNPKHIVFMADTGHHTLGDLARIVIWSLVAGIPYVSFYDITGELLENEEKLFYEVEKKKKGIPGCIKWSNKPDLNGYTNGIQAHTILVNIFCYNDGLPKIAQCIKDIGEGKIVCQSESDEFTAQELDAVLSTIYPSIPDPDLALYTGPLCCTYGLLPWHIRLTEFLQLSPNHIVNINGYLGAIYKYNKCDQRFGK